MLADRPPEDPARPAEDYARLWAQRWLPELCDLLAGLENVPHPVHCSDWDEDGCDCGMEDAMAKLYALVDAGDLPGLSMGSVPHGHPLIDARQRRYRRNQRRFALGHPLLWARSRVRSR